MITRTIKAVADNKAVEEMKRAHAVYIKIFRFGQAIGIYGSKPEFWTGQFSPKRLPDVCSLLAPVSMETARVLADEVEGLLGTKNKGKGRIDDFVARIRPSYGDRKKKEGQHDALDKEHTFLASCLSQSASDLPGVLGKEQTAAEGLLARRYGKLAEMAQKILERADKKEKKQAENAAKRKKTGGESPDDIRKKVFVPIENRIAVIESVLGAASRKERPISGAYEDLVEPISAPVVSAALRYGFGQAQSYRSNQQRWREEDKARKEALIDLYASDEWALYKEEIDGIKKFFSSCLNARRDGKWKKYADRLALLAPEACRRHGIQAPHRGQISDALAKKKPAFEIMEICPPLKEADRLRSKERSLLKPRRCPRLRWADNNCPISYGRQASSIGLPLGPVTKKGRVTMRLKTFSRGPAKDIDVELRFGSSARDEHRCLETRGLQRALLAHHSKLSGKDARSAAEKKQDALTVTIAPGRHGWASIEARITFKAPSQERKGDSYAGIDCKQAGVRRPAFAAYSVLSPDGQGGWSWSSRFSPSSKDEMKGLLRNIGRLKRKKRKIQGALAKQGKKASYAIQKAATRRSEHFAKLAGGLLAQDVSGHQDVSVAFCERFEDLAPSDARTRGQNRNTMDARLKAILKAAAPAMEERGVELVGVMPYYTSQACNRCLRQGRAQKLLRCRIEPKKRKVALLASGSTVFCPACGFHGDPDIQASRNIVSAGLMELKARGRKIPKGAIEAAGNFSLVLKGTKAFAESLDKKCAKRQFEELLWPPSAPKDN